MQVSALSQRSSCLPFNWNSSPKSHIPDSFHSKAIKPFQEAPNFPCNSIWLIQDVKDHSMLSTTDSLLEAASCRINCGICYCTVLLKKLFYFEEETDSVRKIKILATVTTAGKFPAVRPMRTGVSTGSCFILLFCLSQNSAMLRVLQSPHPLTSLTSSHVLLSCISQYSRSSDTVEAKLRMHLEGENLRQIVWNETGMVGLTTTRHQALASLQWQLIQGTKRKGVWKRLFWENVWLAGAVVWCDMQEAWY